MAVVRWPPLLLLLPRVWAQQEGVSPVRVRGEVEFLYRPVPAAVVTTGNRRADPSGEDVWRNSVVYPGGDDGWGNRAGATSGNGGGGVISLLPVGLLCLASSVGMLWWNEGRTLREQQMVSTARRSVASIDGEAALQDWGEGQLLHVTGGLLCEELEDTLFPAVRRRALRLRRIAEMLQWTEREHREETRVSDTQYASPHLTSLRAVSSCHFSSVPSSTSTCSASCSTIPPLTSALCPFASFPPLRSNPPLLLSTSPLHASLIPSPRPSAPFPLPLPCPPSPVIVTSFIVTSLLQREGRDLLLLLERLDQRAHSLLFLPLLFPHKPHAPARASRERN